MSVLKENNEMALVNKSYVATEDIELSDLNGTRLVKRYTYEEALDMTGENKIYLLYHQYSLHPN